MAVSRIVSRGWISATAIVLLAPAAFALNITGLTVTTLVGNTANSSSTNGNNNTQVASSTSVVLAPSGPVADTLGSSLSLQTRYAWLVMADRDNNGAGGLSNTATADYEITFTVDNPTGATYRIDIDTLRLGELSGFTDHSGTSSTSIGAVTGSVDAITQAALALGTLSQTATPGTAGTTINQSSTQLQLTSSAISKLWTLRFTWSGTATSDNDESAVRMGIPGAVAGVTADDYPGVAPLGVRTAANDGHFVTVGATIISVPEPAPAALVAFGLVALALRRRRARR